MSSVVTFPSLSSLLPTLSSKYIGAVVSILTSPVFITNGVSLFFKVKETVLSSNLLVSVTFFPIVNKASNSAFL